LAWYYGFMKKILVADDDPLARGALKRALVDAGFEVTEAADGKEAFEIAKKETPSLAVVDRQMPEMTGQELVEAVRKADWGKSLPIIMLTANEDTSAVNEALKANVSMYFTKSTVSLDEVVEAVKHLAR
jgi:DNA-binding response OmpR family regulator